MTAFATKFPLIAEIVGNFISGNDAATSQDPEFYFTALEASGEDLAAVEAEAGTMEPFQREVIIRGILPAEAGKYDFDEESLTADYPLVGSLFAILSDAADEYEGD